MIYEMNGVNDTEGTHQMVGNSDGEYILADYQFSEQSANFTSAKIHLIVYCIIIVSWLTA